MTIKRPRRPRDANQRAFLTVQISTGQLVEREPSAKQIRASKGGYGHADKLTPEERRL